MDKPHNLIGRAEFLKFPDLLSVPVPARIDTGAKTSAIWASGIKETSDGLVFTLFDNGSEWYTGEQITSKSYTKIAVANSSGFVQERFAVKLRVVLDGRTIKATFTLADRSSQVYPVLVGRNILRGKFIVNVKLGKPLIQREKSREISKRSELEQQSRKDPA